MDSYEEGRMPWWALENLGATTIAPTRQTLKGQMGGATGDRIGGAERPFVGMAKGGSKAALEKVQDHEGFR